MLINLQSKDAQTIPREIKDIQVDSDGTNLVLEYKGLSNIDDCVVLLQADDKAMLELDPSKTTAQQVKQIRSLMAKVFVSHIASWNLPDAEVNKHNITAVLKSQDAMWILRKDFIDLLSEIAEGQPRSQKENEIKNLMSWGGLGLNKAG